MLKRILTAAALLPVFLAILWAGGQAFLLLSAALAAIGSWEYARMWRHRGFQVLPELGIPLTVTLVVAAGLAGAPGLVPALSLAALAVLAAQVWGYGRYTVAETGLALAGVVYVGWLFAHFPLLRAVGGDWRPLLFAFLMTWVTDTGAYFAGRALGRHKLAPALSPGKTVEGAIGGSLAAGVVGALVAPALLGGVLAHAPGGLQLTGGLLAVLVSVAALVGDLAESALKRHVGVKDSGNLLPGHGGVLDRFDSALFTVPVVYYALQLLGG